MEDERSDREETDESGDEDEKEGGSCKVKKNGPVLNGHPVLNNNHHKAD